MRREQLPRGPSETKSGRVGTKESREVCSTRTRLLRLAVVSKQICRLEVEYLYICQLEVQYL